MEPTKATVTKYVFYSEVVYVKERKVKEMVRPGRRNEEDYLIDPGEYKETSLGWFLYMKGSHEAIHLGMDKPEIENGQRIKVTIERVDVNAKPSQTPI